MKKLSKEQIAKRDELNAKLKGTHEDLAYIIGTFNTEMISRFERVREALAKYNDVRAEVREFCSDVCTVIDDYVSTSPEKWQEGDRAQAYADWKDKYQSYEGTDLDYIEINDPEEVEAVDEPPDLTALPEEVES